MDRSKPAVQGIIQDMTLSVIIPAYNEKNTINEILIRVQTMDMVDEIVVVDDGSIDGTREILEEMDGVGPIRVVYHEKNLVKVQQL